jgi:hypothetical protein
MTGKHYSETTSVEGGDKDVYILNSNEMGHKIYNLQGGSLLHFKPYQHLFIQKNSSSIHSLA